MTHGPKFFITTEHTEDLCVAIPVDVDGYGPGVVLWPGTGHLRVPPAGPLDVQRAAYRRARELTRGREAELDRMLEEARRSR